MRCKELKNRRAEAARQAGLCAVIMRPLHCAGVTVTWPTDRMRMFMHRLASGEHPDLPLTGRVMWRGR